MPMHDVVGRAAKLLKARAQFWICHGRHIVSHIVHARTVLGRYVAHDLVFGTNIEGHALSMRVGTKVIP